MLSFRMYKTLLYIYENLNQNYKYFSDYNEMTSHIIPIESTTVTLKS